jgi:hypothetical protein
MREIQPPDSVAPSRHPRIAASLPRGGKESPRTPPGRMVASLGIVAADGLWVWTWDALHHEGRIAGPLGAGAVARIRTRWGRPAGSSFQGVGPIMWQ